MATYAGKDCVVEVSAAGSSFTPVGNVESVDFDWGREELSTDACGEAAGSAIAGKQIFEGTINMMDNPTDAGQVIINAALNATSAACETYLKIKPNTTSGRTAKVFLRSPKNSAGVGDAGKFSVGFRAIAAVTAVP